MSNDQQDSILPPVSQRYLLEAYHVDKKFSLTKMVWYEHLFFVQVALSKDVCSGYFISAKNRPAFGHRDEAETPFTNCFRKKT